MSKSNPQLAALLATGGSTRRPGPVKQARLQAGSNLASNGGRRMLGVGMSTSSAQGLSLAELRTELHDPIAIGW
jgi:hypothetical protein